MASSVRASRTLQVPRRRVLQKRVHRLEQKTEPKEPESTPEEKPAPRFGHAEFAAWIRASEEYSDLQDLKFYRKHPRALADAVEAERERHAFYVARGADPGEARLARLATQIAEERKKKRKRE